MTSPILLTPRFQNYAWGDTAFLPGLYGFPATSRPYAEAWIGAHPALPSMAHVAGGEIPLDRLLDQNAGAVLGADVHARFASLPYLVKILAVARPLSIQVHPSAAEAESGFRRENAAGIALDAPHRNYRDASHKPELFVALTPFEALCGFRPADEIAVALADAPELGGLLPPWEATAGSLRRLVSAYFDLPDERLGPVLSSWVARLRVERPAPGTAAYWMVEADRVFSQPGKPDRGLLFTQLLNLVRLDPGQGLFLSAGVPHAYLRGAGVEVMASSDNVLRAGLTPKHVDRGELLRILRFDMGHWPVIEPRRAGDGVQVYETPAREFEVSRIPVGEPDVEREAWSQGPQTLLFLSEAPAAKLRVASDAAAVELTAGAACLLADDTCYRFSAPVSGEVIKVSVPVADAAPATFRGRSPVRLAFGTSGLRGLVTEITDLEAYVSTRGFLNCVAESGDALPGTPVAIAGDLRPSTDSPERSILRTVGRAVTDAGFQIVYCGMIPTPALGFYGFTKGWPSIMVTGSHIPFDRNGIKFNKSRGEVLKTDERPILEAVHRVRQAEYRRPADSSLFDDEGMFRPAVVAALPPPSLEAQQMYVRRYLDFFPVQALAGMRLAVYEHTAVGRDLLRQILQALGADVYPVGRSSEFVAIDTEAISAAELAKIQRLSDDIRSQRGVIDAIVSTDGDSDRPLLIAVADDGRVRFVSGDVLGIVVADYLGADAIAVPITATDAIDLHFRNRPVQRIRTRVGSPWVIAAAVGLSGHRRVGWEANGGFFVFSPIERAGRTLAPLPTRDAILPLLAALHAARQRGDRRIDRLFAELPRRFTGSGLIDGVSPDAARVLQNRHALDAPGIVAVRFAADGVRTLDAEGSEGLASDRVRARAEWIRTDLERHFNPTRGFGQVRRVDFLDGLRITFDNGDIAHVRGSGNAPQLRIYAVAATDQRAAEIVDMALGEPDGILREMLAEAAGVAEAAEAVGAVGAAGAAGAAGAKSAPRP